MSSVETVRLFHGTSASAWSSIKVEGLQPSRAMLGTAVFATARPEIAAAYAAGKLVPYGFDEMGVVLTFLMPPNTAKVRNVYLVPRIVDPSEIEVVRWVRSGEHQPAGLQVLEHSMAKMAEANASFTASLATLASALAATAR